MQYFKQDSSQSSPRRSIIGCCVSNYLPVHYTVQIDRPTPRRPVADPCGWEGGGVFVTALIDAALARAATQRRRRGAAWLLHLSVGQRGVGT
ncbi:unnamed protein product [Arctia plantaginis]|uniref:Uncharacterized protein n=1 Tax=Arctia plantaginis TaxID=874455 RepID=A0A8S0Z2J8_ARCPL|nr:unnamed protein product [Arctia plantaginis]